MAKSRKTIQKRLIKGVVEEEKGFFSAENIHNKVVKINDNIGIATVYRFLKDEYKMGRLYSYTCKGKTIYSNTKKSHCHFICSDTGKVHHFELDDIDFINKIKEKIPIDEIESIQIDIKGRCGEG